VTIVEFDTDLDRYRVAEIREAVDGESQSRPLGIVHLADYKDGAKHPRFDQQNTLLCSRCDSPAAFVALKPWTALVKEVVALCADCVVDDGYLISVEKLWQEWNATIAHLAEKPAGGGVVQLLRWFGYSGMAKFLGLDDLHRWPVVRGQLSPELRALVLERDGHKCRRCPATENLALDHIRPVSAGGFTTAANLQTLCKSCNSRKGGKRRKHPRCQSAVVAGSPRPPPLCERAAVYLSERPSVVSSAFAEVLDVNVQYLNKVLSRDRRFQCVPGGGRGKPTLWSLVTTPTLESVAPTPPML
jgi:hypothetical protein